MLGTNIVIEFKARINYLTDEGGGRGKGEDYLHNKLFFLENEYHFTDVCNHHYSYFLCMFQGIFPAYLLRNRLKALSIQLITSAMKFTFGATSSYNS